MAEGHVVAVGFCVDFACVSRDCGDDERNDEVRMNRAVKISEYDTAVVCGESLFVPQLFPGTIKLSNSTLLFSGFFFL